MPASTKPSDNTQSARKQDELAASLNDSAATIGTLADARMALLASDATRWSHAQAISAMTRLLVSTVVDATFETLMNKFWHDQSWRDSFDTKTNGERIRGLSHGFAKHGIEVEPAVIEDYLALKYIRNKLAHAQWKPNDLRHVKERGFPERLSELSHSHWRKVVGTAQKIVSYVSTATLDALGDPRFREISDIALALAQSPTLDTFSRLKPMSSSAALQRLVALAAIAEEVDDTYQLSRLTLGAWNTAMSALPGNTALVAATGTLRDLAHEDAYSVIPIGLLKARGALDQLAKELPRHAQGIAAARSAGARDGLLPWDPAMPPGAGAALLAVLLPPEARTSPSDAISALRMGNIAFEAKVLLHHSEALRDIANQTNEEVLHAAAAHALDAAELRERFRTYLESTQSDTRVFDPRPFDRLRSTLV